MSLRILLTSDLHLGMKFAAYPDAQVRLAEERFRCLERIVSRASELSCDLLVVAGDLFERVTMPKRDVDRAAATLARFAGRLAAVLPGNHDYLAPEDELWRRLSDAAGERVLVLRDPRPVPLDHFDLPGVGLYPAPCTSKHSRASSVTWVREAYESAVPRLGIGVAHGSLEGQSPDFAGDYYPMTAADLLHAGPRLWLLGHTHVPYEVSPLPGRLIACAGTPEPDGFDCRHEGGALLLEVDDEGATQTERVPTGGLRFLDESAELRGEADLQTLAQRLAAAAEGGRSLLRLALSGTLPAGGLERLEELRRELGPRLVHLDWRADGLRRAVDAATIDAEYPRGSFPHELLTSLAAAGDAAALEEAYDLLQEARR